MLNKNYIGGEWVEGPDTNRDVNPSNLDDVVGEYARADAAQARAAIAAARAAFPGWARAYSPTTSSRFDGLTSRFVSGPSTHSPPM